MSHYNLRGGLHSAEIRLLQRALREHLQTATKRKADLMKQIGRGIAHPAFEVTQAQDAIDAMVRLSDRLRKELEPVTEPTLQLRKPNEPWPFPMTNPIPKPLTEDSPTGRRIIQEPNIQDLKLLTDEAKRLRKAFINQSNRSNKK